MIVYCIKSPNEIEFRPIKKEDYLNSIARKQWLPPDNKLEIKLPDIGPGDRRWNHYDILTRKNMSSIEEFHAKAALRHWKVMRTVLPDSVWENW
jgi:hypothetical protein